jgi:hypothetical protein
MFICLYDFTNYDTLNVNLHIIMFLPCGTLMMNVLHSKNICNAWIVVLLSEVKPSLMSQNFISMLKSEMFMKSHSRVV